MALRHTNTQHRPQRDDGKANREELRLLKQENKRLKRELMRARKQLAKLLQNQSSDIADQAVEMDARPEGPECPECGSDEIREIPAGPKTIMVCRDCRWRKTL